MLLTNRALSSFKAGFVSCQGPTLRCVVTKLLAVYVAFLPQAPVEVWKCSLGYWHGRVHIPPALFDFVQTRAQLGSTLRARVLV